MAIDLEPVLGRRVRVDVGRGDIAAADVQPLDLIGVEGGEPPPPQLQRHSGLPGPRIPCDVDIGGDYVCAARGGAET
jgi:hypothetical protein